MAKLETETRKQINEYYDEKLKDISKKLNKIKDQYVNEKEEQFKNDEVVKQIKELFEVVKRKFPELRFNLECELKSSYYQENLRYYELEEYEELINEIDNIKNERRKLILELEANSKNSKVFQNAINKFIKKLEGE